MLCLPERIHSSSLYHNIIEPSERPRKTSELSSREDTYILKCGTRVMTSQRCGSHSGGYPALDPAMMRAHTEGDELGWGAVVRNWGAVERVDLGLPEERQQDDRSSQASMDCVILY